MDKHELLALVAVPMIAAGAWLRWRLSWYRSDFEEDVKDKKITEAQARQRIALMHLCCPALTVAGLVLLLVGLRMLSF